MVGVILAGGRGTRLMPLTGALNKHLLPVGGVPMLWHPLRTLARACVSRAVVVLGDEHPEQVVKVVGDGSAWGLELAYVYQGRPRGIPDAIRAARPFARNEDMLVILGDNVYLGDLREAVRSFKRGARALVTRVEDPQHYAVVELDHYGSVVGIEEKPSNPRSQLAVTGMYLLDGMAHEYAAALEPSARGETEVADLLGIYLKHNMLSADVIPSGTWADAGASHAHLAAAGRLAEKMNAKTETTCAS